MVGCEAQHFKRKDETEVKTTTHFKQFINETIDEIMFPLRLRVTLGLQFAFAAMGHVHLAFLLHSRSVVSFSLTQAHQPISCICARFCIVYVFFLFISFHLCTHTGPFDSI